MPDLEAAIAAAPDDDAPRLVYADALLAKGDLRGELIVVQCELARGGSDRDRGIILRRREAKLLAEHAARWSNLGGLGKRPVFRRGFVDEITIGVASFVEREEAIAAVAPLVRRARFTGFSTESDATYDEGRSAWADVQAPLGQALASGRITWFEAIDAETRWWHEGEMSTHERRASLGDALVRWLVESGRIHGLRGLEVHGVHSETLGILAAPGIEELALDGDVHGTMPSSALRPRRLSLCDQGPAPDRSMMRQQLESPLTERVVDLELASLTPAAGFRPGLVFAGLPFTRHLRRLKGGISMETADWNRLATAPELSTVEELVVHHLLHEHHPPQADLGPLFAPEHLEALRVLRISRGVSPEMARALLDSPLAKRLEVIDLRSGAPDELAAVADELRDRWDGVLLF